MLSESEQMFCSPFETTSGELHYLLVEVVQLNDTFHWVQMSIDIDFENLQTCCGVLVKLVTVLMVPLISGRRNWRRRAGVKGWGVVDGSQSVRTAN